MSRVSPQSLWIRDSGAFVAIPTITMTLTIAVVLPRLLLQPSCFHRFLPISPKLPPPFIPVHCRGCLVTEHVDKSNTVVFGYHATVSVLVSPCL